MSDHEAIMSIKYSMEWEDHLHDIYENFGRRNNINEWIYFFRRPEMADTKKHDEIAIRVLQYILWYGNIMQDIVKAIDDTFHYSQKREAYESFIGYEGMESYEKRLLLMKEFPPYDLFEEYDEEKDYDSFLNGFREIYFDFHAEDPGEYRKKLEELKKLEIYHPYLALLESEYYILCGEWEAAVHSLKELEDGYYKSMSMGILFEKAGSFDIAEECFGQAIKYRPDKLDAAVVSGYLMSLWNNHKEGEALLMAGQFTGQGYEYMVKPLKQMFLEELSQILMEKAGERELTEGEMLILIELYKLYGQYDIVADIARKSLERGFEEERWIVDLAEACVETGDYEDAQNIIEMVYSGEKKLTLTQMNRIREIKARLLFSIDRIADAYDIMAVLCERPESSMQQRFCLVQMYMKTGKIRSAIRFLRRLRYESAGNLYYTYHLARCFMLSGEWETAKELFEQVFMIEPKLERTAYHMVQCMIECGSTDDVEKGMKQAEDYLSIYEKRYLKGQLLEMWEKFHDAKKLYKNIAEEYSSGLFPKELLYDSLVRYFLMWEETGGKIGPMLEKMKKTLEQYPDASQLWLYRADFHEKVQVEEDNIEKCCRMALKADPYNREAMLRLVSAYAEQENWEQVGNIGERIIIYTDLEEGYLLRAQGEFYQGKRDRCMSDLDMYLKLGGDKNKVREVRGIFAMEMGLYEEALDHYQEKLKKRNVSEVPCYDDVAVCLCKLGRFKEAADLLDVVCEDSKYHPFHELLYHIQLYTGDFAGAKSTLKRYQKIFKINRMMDDDYLLMAAQLAMESGKLIQAQNIADSIASHDGERLCGILEIVHMNFGNAARLFRKLVKKQPDVIDNYSWLSLALYFSGAQLESVSYARQGIAVFEKLYGRITDIKRSDRLCQYAFLKTLCGEREEAWDKFNMALSVPTCPEYVCKECYEAHYGLGVYHLYNGNQQDARMEFEQALTIKPCNTVCRKMREMI